MSALSIEQVQALYFDANALREPSYRVYRADGGENRWYYRPDTDRYYVSVTSLVGSTNPTPKTLQDWQKKNGRDSDVIMEQRGAYGTLMHSEMTRLLLDQRYDLDRVRDLVESVDRRGDSADVWAKDLRQDLLAFEYFRRMFELKPVAVEAIVTSEDGYGGAVDLAGEITIGDRYVSGPKRWQLKDPDSATRGLILTDYKCGRKGFYESHEMQLHLYWKAWNENFPDHPAIGVFNFAPKGWQTWPDFSFKDQSGSRHAAKIPHMIDQFWAYHREPGNSVRIGGVIEPDAPIESFFSSTSIRDVVHSTITRAA